MSLEKLRYPIGRFKKPDIFDEEVLAKHIADFSTFPASLKKEVGNLTVDQLEIVYRPGGWTIRQLVHHCAESHMNAFARFKFALTEEKPTIKPYDEAAWAELSDSRTLPIEPSLRMLEGIHERLTSLLLTLSREQLQRKLVHPEHGTDFQLYEMCAMYAWHSNHHLAHVKAVKESKRWKK